MLLGQNADGVRDEALLGLDRPAMDDGDGFQYPLQIIALGGVEPVPQKRREMIDGGVGVGGGGAIPACLSILVRRGFSRDLRHDRARKRRPVARPPLRIG
ncbi:hypothetical protein [Methylorubrum extorquens]|uniref:hypothetical protein n=1 Tax=Methylorubrum extorquens TaxID=408 RepID=UPI0005A735C0|nr:hypothetical protein [Methylorubrum extorquens]KQP87879.1 hypothetical protein ASF55_08720 [Methylobacterium sp. Leaf119]WIU37820.1 hypothetical protein KQ926_14485 [Methylorubrum extorquens]